MKLILTKLQKLIIVENAAIMIAGFVICLVNGFQTVIGLTLLLVGLFQLAIELWIFKIQRKILD